MVRSTSLASHHDGHRLAHSKYCNVAVKYPTELDSPGPSVTVVYLRWLHPNLSEIKGLHLSGVTGSESVVRLLTTARGNAPLGRAFLTQIRALLMPIRATTGGGRTNSTWAVYGGGASTSLSFKPPFEFVASTSNSDSSLESPASMYWVDQIGGGRWGGFRAHLSSRQAHPRIKSDISSVLPNTMANMIWPFILWNWGQEMVLGVLRIDSCAETYETETRRRSPVTLILGIDIAQHRILGISREFIW